MISNNWTEQQETKLRLVKSAHTKSVDFYKQNPSRIRQSIAQKYIQLLEQKIAA